MAKNKTSEGPSARPPVVISRHGSFRYQRGMATATLLRWGLPLDEAIEAASILRQSLLGRERIESHELEGELERLVAERYGFERVPVLDLAGGGDVPLVRSHRGVLPFSRGVIVRRLVATGLSAEDATRVAEAVALRLRELDSAEVPESQVDDAVEQVLMEAYGQSHTRRYKVTTFVRRSDQPLLLLIGGAMGTGKSTLATELAYRLGISNTTSTDMIREAMRTVLSPALVPGLHDHSFRGMVQGGKVLSNPRERVLAGFRQQAAQVSVGVRGVLRRALREGTSTIIEGTHLLPPFSQLLQPGARGYLAGVVLAVPGTREHRRRFPARGRSQPDRRAEPYLDAFQSVRWIQEDLLRLVETYDGVVLGNEEVSETVTGVVEYLSHVLPIEAGRPRLRTRSAARRPAIERTLLLILDGLSDEGHPALAGSTPMAAAELPTLCQLAGAGGQGQLITVADGREADTAEGLSALLAAGRRMPRGLGRGLLEALGAGLPLVPGMILWRGNLATLDSAGVVVSRRAGRIREGVAELLAALHDVPLPGGVVGGVYPGHEHRVVVTLRGAGLSPAVRDTDPRRAGLPPNTAGPLDDTPEAARSAEALERLLALTRAHLQSHPINEARQAKGAPIANTVLTRGASDGARLANLPEPPRPSAIVSGCPTALGVGRAVGMTPVTDPAMTGNLDTDLDLKLSVARRLLGECELVAVHFKGTDIAAHDRQPLAKRDYLEAVDAALGRFIDSLGVGVEELRIVVSADHGTSSLSGEHLSEPVPVLVGRWEPDAEPAEFNEDSAAQGALGLLTCQELTAMLWEQTVASAAPEEER